ncbi:MAG: aspartyl/asparaginyl beta-hydroxylase domain-containing protein [Sphingomonadales bacterium]|jgi:tetratricopeptide (TPR) repeat protein
MAAQDTKVDIESILESAFVKDAAGKKAEAKALVEEVLDIDPNEQRALSFLAQAAVKSQKFDEAISYVTRVIQIEPDVVGHRHSLGLCYDSKRDFEASVKTYREAIDLDPSNAVSYLFYGCAATMVNEGARAASAFSAAFQLDPGMMAALESGDIPPVMRERIEFASKFLENALNSLHQAAVQDTGKRFPGEDLERVAKGVWAGQEVKYKDPKQRPTVFYMPDLKPKPVFDRGSFRWLPELERAHMDILAEFEAAKGKAQSEMGLTAHLGAQIEVEDPDFWKTIHLYRNTTEVEENTALFPKTVEILKAFPLSQLGGQTVSAYFSTLAPGARIPGHHGQVNTHATVHLPLVTDEKARIQIGDKWYSWQQGKAFVFDDSFEHRVENLGDEPRVMLVFEIWNPYLSLAERTAVEASFARRKNWYENRAI